jgi:CRISPR/Cas system-associated protein Cas10 (large subunit of type III CRISPR-Cas system)
MSNNNNDYNIIDISGKDSSPKKYFCNHCRRSLFLRDKDTQEYLCSFCNIIYYPNNQLVKKANRFEVPDGSDPNVDKSPPIVMMDDVNKDVSSTLYKHQKLAAAYKALQHQGFKFTTYEER